LLQVLPDKVLLSDDTPRLQRADVCIHVDIVIVFYQKNAFLLDETISR
jgi:hypothetical protein